MSWLFKSGGQSIGASAPASVLPMNIQGWFPLWLADLISLQSFTYFIFNFAEFLIVLYLFLLHCILVWIYLWCYLMTAFLDFSFTHCVVSTFLLLLANVSLFPFCGFLQKSANPWSFVFKSEAWWLRRSGCVCQWRFWLVSCYVGGVHCKLTVFGGFSVFNV